MIIYDMYNVLLVSHLGFEGRTLVLIVSVPGHCLPFTFTQGQLLEGVEYHIYLYCFTFDDINLNRAFVIFVLFPK